MRDGPCSDDLLRPTAMTSAESTLSAVERGHGRGRTSARRRFPPVVFVLVVGILLGVPLAELTGFFPSPWYYLAQLATPWLVASFLAAYLCWEPAPGVLAAISVLAVGLLSQVVYKTVVYGGYSVRAELDVAPYWAILAVGLGASMGIAGVLAHSDRTWFRAYAWAVPTAVASVEVLTIAFGFRSYGPKVAVVVGVTAALMWTIGAARSAILPMLAASASLIVGGFVLFTLVHQAVPMF